MQVGVPPADSVQAALREVFAKPEYQWQEVFSPGRAFWRFLAAIAAWLDRLRSDRPAIYQLLIAALVIVLLAIVAHAAWVAARTIARATEALSPTLTPSTEAPRDARWYAQRAARLAKAGRYVEAMHADFLRLILELDQRRAVRFHPSKTPQEYLVERGLSDHSRAALAEVIRRLYAHAFAGEPCDQRVWSEWRQRTRTEGYAPAQ